MARKVEVELKTVKARVRRLIERVKVGEHHQRLWIVMCRDLVQAHTALERALERMESLSSEPPGKD